MLGFIFCGNIINVENKLNDKDIITIWYSKLVCTGGKFEKVWLICYFVFHLSDERNNTWKKY